MLALALALIACGDDAPTGPTAAQGPGGSTTSQGGGGAGPGGGGAGGVGGSTPTCTDDPTLCTDQGLVCHEGSCVECAPGDDEGCTGETPWCNPATLACEACSYHEHCPGSACNVFTGACLDADPKTVGPDPGDDFASLTLALASIVGDDEEAVFLVKPNVGMTPYVEDLQVGGTRAVALIAQTGRPRLQGNSFATFTVANGATLLLEGIDLKSNGNAVALSAAGLVALDRVEITQNSGGGISAGSTAELLIRNSIIAANGINQTEDALILNGKATILSSTIAGLVLDPSAAINCSSTYELTVRNSILLKRHGSGSALAGCGNATIETSYDDSVDQTTGMSWFAGWPGNLRLTAAGKDEFADVAQWQSGDPPTDIDGQPRPTSEGPDVAGAHLGP